MKKNKPVQQWAISKEDLIETCLAKIASIPNDPTLFVQSLKVDLIKQWIAEIERIQRREELP